MFTFNLAPEILQNKNNVYNENSDIFSFGKMVFFMLNGTNPHDG